jgi:internalin A
LKAYVQSRVPSITRFVKGRITAIDVGQIFGDIEMPARHEGTTRIFISYSHKDDEFRAELEVRLKILQQQGFVRLWSDRRIAAGSEWRGEIDENLQKADLILILLSDDFLASDYCYDVEMKKALERFALRQTRILPIVLRQCAWRRTPLGNLQALPDDAKPIRLWADRDSAWHSVFTGIEGAVVGSRK